MSDLPDLKLGDVGDEVQAVTLSYYQDNGALILGPNDLDAAEAIQVQMTDAVSTQKTIMLEIKLKLLCGKLCFEADYSFLPRFSRFKSVYKSVIFSRDNSRMHDTSFSVVNDIEIIKKKFYHSVK